MSKKTRAYSLVLLFIFVGCAVVQFLAAADIRALMLDTDALNVPTVVDNLLSHGGHLSHWYLSPAPYLFPDALVHAAMHPFTSSMYVRLAMFAGVQIVLLFLLVWRLALRTNRQHPLTIAVAVTGNFVWAALLRGGPFNQMMTAGFHYGAFLVSLAVVILALPTHNGRWRWPLIAVLSIATAFSDNIFVIQTAVPLAAVLVIVALFDAEHRAHRLVTAGVVAVSSIAGSLLYGPLITHHTRYPVHLTSDKFRENARAARDVVREFARHHEPMAATVVLSGVIALFFTVRLMKRVRRTTPFALFSMFAFVSVMSTCVGLVLATANEMTIRYFIPVFTWPLIVCAFIILNTDLFREKLPLIVATLTAIMLMLNTSTFVDTHGIDREYYPADIACIDALLPPGGSPVGMSNYWDAKYIQAFSKRDVRVAQFWDNLTPMKWITTDDYYQPSFDFAVISTNMPPQFTLSHDQLLKKFGQPTSTTTCGTRIVLVYGRGE